MANPKTYSSAPAFRRALEDRLTQMAKSQGLDLARLRRMVAFERLLARLFSEQQPKWILKGGYALEMRFRESARATRDIDLALPEVRFMSDGGKIVSGKLLEKLERSAATDLGDWFRFNIGVPTDELGAQPYGGFRFPVESRVDNRKFTTFHFDISLGDAVLAGSEWITGHDLLAFAGVPPAKIALIPKEQQFAEKVHAYTLPRSGVVNSRARDLVDLVLLIERGSLEEELIGKAVKATFKRRGTHAIPAELKPPPEEWEEPYRQMAEDINLSVKELTGAFHCVLKYWQGLNPKIVKE